MVVFNVAFFDEVVDGAKDVVLFPIVFDAVFLSIRSQVDNCVELFDVVQLIAVGLWEGLFY